MITVAYPTVVRRRSRARCRKSRLVAVLAACMLATLGIVPTSAGAREPAQGMLLVASRDMHGTWFARSVILLIQHDEYGTVGLVINRPTDLAPGDLLPDLAGASQLRDKLYIGGPVEAHGVMMLLRSERAPADAAHVFANVYASGDPELLEDLAHTGDKANRVRLYAGYAGWVPGQLDAEIRRGSWTVMPAQVSHIFSNDPREIWERLAPTAQPIIVLRGNDTLRF